MIIMLSLAGPLVHAHLSLRREIEVKIFLFDHSTGHKGRSYVFSASLATNVEPAVVVDVSDGIVNCLILRSYLKSL